MLEEGSWGGRGGVNTDQPLAVSKVALGECYKKGVGEGGAESTQTNLLQCSEQGGSR